MLKLWVFSTLLMHFSQLGVISDTKNGAKQIFRCVSEHVIQRRRKFSSKSFNKFTTFPFFTLLRKVRNPLVFLLVARTGKIPQGVLIGSQPATSSQSDTSASVLRNHGPLFSSILRFIVRTCLFPVKPERAFGLRFSVPAREDMSI